MNDASIPSLRVLLRTVAGPLSAARELQSAESRFDELAPDLDALDLCRDDLLGPLLAGPMMAGRLAAVVVRPSAVPVRAWPAPVRTRPRHPGIAGTDHVLHLLPPEMPNIAACVHPGGSGTPSPGPERPFRHPGTGRLHDYETAHRTVIGATASRETARARLVAAAERAGVMMTLDRPLGPPVPEHEARHGPARSPLPADPLARRLASALARIGQRRAAAHGFEPADREAAGTATFDRPLPTDLPSQAMAAGPTGSGPAATPATPAAAVPARGLRRLAMLADAEPQQPAMPPPTIDGTSQPPPPDDLSRRLVDILRREARRYGIEPEEGSA